jgi:hypothetical protein
MVAIGQVGKYFLENCALLLPPSSAKTTMINNNDELSEKMLCHRCVGDDYLTVEIERDGTDQQCSYCKKVAKSYGLNAVVDRVELAFEQHYVRTSDQPDAWQQTLQRDRESTYDWDRDGQPVLDAIGCAVNVEEEIARDIHEILEDRYSDMESAQMGEETEFSGDSYYEMKSTSDAAWQDEWHSFESALRTEARYFSRKAAAQLSSIFGNLDDLLTVDGNPLVIDAGPGTTLATFFRARVFQSDVQLMDALCRPDHKLGPPPALFSTAGRMNARGISVFYGSNAAGAAIAEVRPPVGSQVAVVRFDVIRPIRLLDLTALKAAIGGGSVFDPNSIHRKERAMFLRSLSERMTRPVMPDDEAFAYLATQAVADFLATEDAPTFDGILFPSVQVSDGSLNVVLFHKSARVEELDIPAGTTIEARTYDVDEDGRHPDYSVREEVPAVVQAVEPADPFEAYARFGHEGDVRQTTLRVVLDSLRVHQLRRVEFVTHEFEVERYRYVRSDAGSEF